MLIKAASLIYSTCVVTLTIDAIIDPTQGTPWGGIIMLPMFAYALYEQHQQTKETEK